MATTIPPTAAVHYLVTFTVPFDVDTSTDANVLTFRAGAPTTEARRLSPAEAEVVLAALAPRRILEATLAAALRPPTAPEKLKERQEGLEAWGAEPADPTPSEQDDDGLQPYIDEESKAVAVVDEPAPSTTPRPKSKVKSAKKQATARKASTKVSASESEAINTTIRTTLAAGGTFEEAAEKAGITVRAAKHRATMLKLQPTSAPEPAAKVPAPPKSKGTAKVTGLPNPKPADRSAQAKPRPLAKPTAHPVDERVPALGAKRRILSLFANGHDPDTIGVRAPAVGSTGVLAVIALEDDDTIHWDIHDRIDQVYKQMRFMTFPPAPGWRHLDRTAPKPTAWTDHNIDDPNTYPSEQQHV